MRLDNPRAAGVGGVLLTTMLATVPTVALSDTETQSQAPPAPSVPTAPTTTSTAPRVPATLSVTAVRGNVLAGRRVLVQGALRPTTAGVPVALEVSRGRGWTMVDRDRTTSQGRYRLAWRANETGTALLRVRFRGTAELAPARRRAGTANVYRRALASWYGPGFYGQHLACGGTLYAGTLGVAHKTLPCGTKVTLRYHGNIVRVPVVDRGPYVAGREFDLTAATKARLRFGSTGMVMTTR